MNLLRPINIVAGERPLSIFETVSWRREGSSTSSKVRHISSDARCRLPPSPYFSDPIRNVTPFPLKRAAVSKQIT
jgi:hypothetical protein